MSTNNLMDIIVTASVIVFLITFFVVVSRD